MLLNPTGMYFLKPMTQPDVAVALYLPTQAPRRVFKLCYTAALMRLQVSYTPGDYTEAHRLHRSASFWSRWGVRMGLVLGVLLMAAGTLLFAKAGRDAWRGLFPFLCGGMFVFSLTILPTFAQRRQFNRNPQLRHSYLFEFSEEGIRGENPISRSELRWDVVQRWLENEQMFLLYTSPRLFIMLPKRAFGAGIPRVAPPEGCCAFLRNTCRRSAAD